MHRVTMLLAIVAIAVAGALTLIGERMAITRTGYRVAELRRQKRQLEQQNLELEAEAAKLRAAGRIIEKVKDLDLPVVPPDEKLEKEQEKSPKER